MCTGIQHWALPLDLILLQLEDFCGNTILLDQLDFNTVTSVDVTLSGDNEQLLDDRDDLLLRQSSLLIQTILMSDQIVQQRPQEVLSRAHATIIVAFERTNGVVAVNAAFSFVVEASNHTEGVVREEAAIVQCCTQQLCDGRGAHLDILGMGVSVQ